MKKTTILLCAMLLGTVILAGALLIPFRVDALNDGGTEIKSAVLYKIVDWNRLTNDGIYQNSKVYWLSDAHKSVDELWREEKPENENSMLAYVTWLEGDTVRLKAEDQKLCRMPIVFTAEGISDLHLHMADKVRLYYSGKIEDYYPAKIHITSIERVQFYADDYVNRDTAERMENNEELYTEVYITEIYDDYFMARRYPHCKQGIKINGKIGDAYKTGEYAHITYENGYADAENCRVEMDLVSIRPGDKEPPKPMTKEEMMYD